MKTKQLTDFDSNDSEFEKIQNDILEGIRELAAERKKIRPEPKGWFCGRNEWDVYDQWRADQDEAMKNLASQQQT